jgi:DeoR family glycerol-3-phosphate regulon repressor
MATAQIAQFKAEHVVLTVGAITTTAIMDYDLRETEMARAMIAQAQSITVLADHHKLGRPAVFQVADLAKVARLVINRQPDPEMAAALAAAGVEIVVADPDPS